MSSDPESTPAEKLIAELGSEDFVQSAMRSAEESAKKRAQRREELFDKAIKAKVCVVAWIDLLGFSQQMQQVKTDDDLRAAYRKMLFVHEQFDKVSASDDPETQAEINKNYGRTILALSDGVLIAAGLDAAALVATTPYDLLMSLVGEIIMAQAHCALEGIFLRGGVSIGQFYFEDDILLSSGLIRAYKLETERACYPVILITPQVVAKLRKLPGIKHYAKNFEPSQSYFLPFKSPRQKKGERFYFLDYISYIAHPDNHGFYAAEDRKAWSDRRRRPEERDRIFSESHWKSALRSLQHHKKMLIAAYGSCSSEKAKAKYRWLMRYHNRTIKRFGSFHEPALIDLSQFARCPAAK